MNIEMQINVGDNVSKQQLLALLGCYLEQHYEGDWISAYIQIISIIENKKSNTYNMPTSIETKAERKPIVEKPTVEETAITEDKITTREKPIIQGPVRETSITEDKKEETFDNDAPWTEKPKSDIPVFKDDEEQFDNDVLQAAEEVKPIENDFEDKTTEQPKQDNNFNDFESKPTKTINEFEDKFDDKTKEKEKVKNEEFEVDEFGDIIKKEAPKKTTTEDPAKLPEPTSAPSLESWEDL